MQQRRTRQRTNAAALPAKERPRRARVLSDDDESSDGGWTRVEEDPDFEMVAAAPAPKNFLHRGQSEKSSDTSSYVGASVKSSQKEDKENLDDQRSQSDFSELSFGFGVSLEALACEPCEPAAQNPTPTPERAALSPVSEHCDGWCELLTGHTATSAPATRVGGSQMVLIACLRPRLRGPHAVFFGRIQRRTKS